MRFEVVTSEWQVDFARVVHSFEHMENFDSYLSRAGHIVLPDDPADLLAD